MSPNRTRIRRTLASATVAATTLAVTACTSSPDSPNPTTTTTHPARPETSHYAPVDETICGRFPIAEILEGSEYQLPADPFTASHGSSEESPWRVDCTYRFRPDDRSSDIYINSSLRIYGDEDPTSAEEVYERELPDSPRTPPTDLAAPPDLPWDRAAFYDAFADDIAYEHYAIHRNVYVFLFVQARPPDDADTLEIRDWLHDTFYELIAAVYEHLPRTATDAPSRS